MRMEYVFSLSTFLNRKLGEKDRYGKESMPVALVSELRLEALQRPLEMRAWCAIQSQNLIDGAGLALHVLASGLLDQSAQLFRIAG